MWHWYWLMWRWYYLMWLKNKGVTEYYNGTVVCDVGNTWCDIKKKGEPPNLIMVQSYMIFVLPNVTKK